MVFVVSFYGDSDITCIGIWCQSRSALKLSRSGMPGVVQGPPFKFRVLVRPTKNQELTTKNRYSCGFSSPEILSLSFAKRGLFSHGLSLISSARARSSWNIVSICAAMPSS